MGKSCEQADLEEEAAIRSGLVSVDYAAL